MQAQAVTRGSQFIQHLTNIQVPNVRSTLYFSPSSLKHCQVESESGIANRIQEESGFLLAGPSLPADQEFRSEKLRKIKELEINLKSATKISHRSSSQTSLHGLGSLCQNQCDTNTGSCASSGWAANFTGFAHVLLLTWSWIYPSWAFPWSCHIQTSCCAYQTMSPNIRQWSKVVT